MSNPYEAPKAPLGDTLRNDPGIEQVASGQKLVIYAILVYLAIILVRGAGETIAGLLAIASLVLSLMGILRISSGLGYGTGTKVILVILMFVPLVGLITLLVLNAKATNRLREAGYKVGLLGASR
ncbi:hypothetical protein FHW84_001389 [Dyella sp. SG562]|jgi:hypothetical protein|uniref:hypothetical protein n=1 Tax=unclassified Dyella TaxID=2634549 RepID=UPI001422AA29|nr:MULTISPECIES: hypothetical protein [unclassified Dyella]NII72823.1 hypothetical protein [Dyella sp. SG562]NKJ21644.1 hypothetical protein [Dyella sp. SG609]